MLKRSLVKSKITIQPIHIQLLHNEVFMGPCRYGEGNDLTYEGEMHVTRKKIIEFDEDIKKNIDSNAAVVLDTKLMEWNEDFIVKEDRLNKVLENDSQVDLYLLTGGMISYIASIIAERTGKPIAFCPVSGSAFPRLGGIDAAAYLKSKGIQEVYNALNYDDLNSIIRAIKARYALRRTKALYALRNNVLSIGCVSSFINLSDITKRFGMEIIHYNSLEFFNELDHMSSEEEEKAKELLNELTTQANSISIPTEEMLNDVRFYIIVNKILDRFECNAFTLPCFELCATKQLNNRHFMFCLTHSLLKDEGIASACAADVGSIISLQILMAMAQKAPHMGNCAIFCNELENNKMRILHDVCSKYMKGYDADPLPIDYVSYTKGNWGATMRYDFAKDIGETITMINISPDMSKIMIGRGTICGGEGYLTPECTHAVVFHVTDSRDFYEKESQIGHHFAWVYGDYTKDLIAFAKLMNLEAVLAL